jgi:hypothetical protein
MIYASTISAQVPIIPLGRKKVAIINILNKCLAGS